MRRYNILALSTYSIERPLGGGQIVISGIYKYLSNFFDIVVLSIISHQERKNVTIKKGLQNIMIPISPEEAKVLWDMERRYGIGLSDYIHLDNISLCTEYIKEFEQLSSWADIIILEHPYLVNVLDFKKVNKKIIYHAIDIEVLQKEKLYENFPELLCNVKAAEAKACNYADAIFTVSEEEKKVLKELYLEPTKGKEILVVPNSIDTEMVPFISRPEHLKAKEKYGLLSEKIICLFVGSWHPPNLEGLEYIGNRLAPKNADIQYFVVGSVKDFFYDKYHPNHKFPENVHLFGILEEDEKWELYKVVDYAINPMFSGAGTNVKMFEYMAAGLPIISTPFGVRGINSAKICYFENEEEFFAIIPLLAKNDQLQKDLILNNLWVVKTYYDLQTVADKIRDFIYKELLDDYSSYLVDRLSAELLSFSQIDYDLIYDNFALELSKII